MMNRTTNRFCTEVSARSVRMILNNDSEHNSRRAAAKSMLASPLSAGQLLRPTGGTVRASIRRSAGARWAYVQLWCHAADRHNGAHARRSDFLGKISRPSAPWHRCRPRRGSGCAARISKIRRTRHDNPMKPGPGYSRRIRNRYPAVQPKLGAQSSRIIAAGRRQGGA